jgi:NADPH:quinone reductase-like Zn-dependent oxidoreductase
MATGLRGRSIESKGAIVAQVREHLWPLVESGAVQPIVGATVPMSNAAEAHRLLDESDVFGKVLLKRER